LCPEIAEPGGRKAHHHVDTDVDTGLDELGTLSEGEGLIGECREGGESSQYANHQEESLIRAQQRAGLDEPAKIADGQTTEDVDRQSAVRKRWWEESVDEPAQKEAPDRPAKTAESDEEALPEEGYTHAAYLDRRGAFIQVPLGRAAAGPGLEIPPLASALRQSQAHFLPRVSNPARPSSSGFMAT